MTVNTLELADQVFAREGCDSCGEHVRATQIATLGPLLLTFCDHHATKHGPELLAQGFVIEALTAE